MDEPLDGVQVLASLGCCVWHPAFGKWSREKGPHGQFEAVSLEAPEGLVGDHRSVAIPTDTTVIFSCHEDVPFSREGGGHHPQWMLVQWCRHYCSALAGNVHDKECANVNFVRVK